ncbi:MAG: contractile injection system tape measure protein [Cyclobacteriaceae bacterium]
MGNKQISIGQLNFDLISGENEDATFFVDQIRDVVLPIVSGQLATLASISHDISIDRLDIDIQEVQSTAWQSNVSKKISSVIEQTVREKHEEKRSSSTQNASSPSRFTDETHLPASKLNGQTADDFLFTAENLRKLSNTEILDKLSSLLPDVVQMIFSDLLMVANNSSLRNKLISSVIRSYRYGEILKLDDWQKQLVNELLQDQSGVPELIALTGQDLSLPSEKFLNILLETYQAEAAEIDLLSLLSGSLQAEKSLSDFFKAVLSADSISKYAKKWFLESLDDFKNSRPSFESWTNKIANNQDDMLLLQDLPDWKIMHNDPENSRKLDRIKEVIKRWKNKPQLNSDNAYESVENGGIVLIHPFLPLIFKKSGLLDEHQKWKDASAKEEAIYLVHYLATGQMPTVKDDLTVAKILTATEPDTILTFEVTDPTFTHVDQIMDETLETIREYWPPMGNISWQVLRKDFLKRRAKLYRSTEKEVNLMVEPHALDILIPYKRWGLSVVRYSWMQTMLKIDWGKKYDV